MQSSEDKMLGLKPVSLVNKHNRLKHMDMLNIKMMLTGSSVVRWSREKALDRGHMSGILEGWFQGNEKFWHSS